MTVKGIVFVTFTPLQGMCDVVRGLLWLGAARGGSDNGLFRQLAVAVAAEFIPARRAARFDPVLALRAE